MTRSHHRGDPPGIARILTVLGWAVAALLAGLVAIVVLRACIGIAESGWTPTAVATLAGVTGFVACCALGARSAAGTEARARRARRIRLVWLAAAVLIWAGLVWVAADALFLAFPLCFIVLHERPGLRGIAWVAGITAIAVVVPGLRSGWSLGGVIGPVLGAAVAVVISAALEAFIRQARERDRLIGELTDTRDRLAAAERESGVLAERARIGRDLHDTVAQALSSIQLLLHAAERGALDPAVRADVRLARETAGDALAESRRFIAGLRADATDGLAAALQRLAVETTAISKVPVGAHVTGDPHDLDEVTAGELLRIAQGAVANAVRHAGATRVDLTLSHLGSGEVALDVVDDGAGFDPATTSGFGLQSMRERAAALGGTLSIESAPGRGTAVAVTVPGRSA
ncbi:sensor histidine kinase [Agromyces larvae]|uniref:Oxygen sensor histidine kinase NreB n=1 Tax=Agromyces larvae TaxID=2929802 RepID=A0ABY4BVI3_9MICO|nr:sensor histidine kinase [Agromyces larvae]UOE43189.1 sensor histidine kinase [Agromyces larvae]